MVIEIISGKSYDVVPIPTFVFNPATVNTAAGQLSSFNNFGLSLSVFVGSVSGFTLSGSSGYTYVATPVSGGLSFTPLTGFAPLPATSFGGGNAIYNNHATTTHADGTSVYYQYDAGTNKWYATRTWQSSTPPLVISNGTTTTVTPTEPTIGPAVDAPPGTAPGIPVTPSTVGAVVGNAAVQLLFGSVTMAPNAINGPDSLNNRVFSTGPGMINEAIAQSAGIDPDNPRFGLATAATQFIGVLALPRAGVAGDQGILSAAARGQGNFGLGSASFETAMRLGRDWVGKGYRLASDGKTLVSADGLRAFRPPSFKPRLGKMQANFEQRPGPSGKWTSNGHLDVP